MSKFYKITHIVGDAGFEKEKLIINQEAEDGQTAKEILKDLESDNWPITYYPEEDRAIATNPEYIGIPQHYSDFYECKPSVIR